MTTLLIEGKTKADVKMLRELAERLGFRITELTKQHKEDLGLVSAIKEGRQSPLVSRASVMRVLDRK
jgi:hypothetical protein